MARLGNIAKINGVRQVIAALKRQKGANQKALEAGLLKAGLFLQRKSQKIVPVDTGALKNSAFTRLGNKGRPDVFVTVGYTQSYAIYVHEDLVARHRPGKTAKYLERPARENAREIRAIIARELGKVKK